MRLGDRAALERMTVRCGQAYDITPEIAARLSSDDLAKLARCLVGISRYKSQIATITSEAGHVVQRSRR